MSTTRKAVVIHEEDFSAMTLLKPFSDEYLNYLIVIHEDAYGEMKLVLTPKEDVRKRLNLSEEEFAKVLNNIGI